MRSYTSPARRTVKIGSDLNPAAGLLDWARSWLFAVRTSLALRQLHFWPGTRRNGRKNGRRTLIYGAGAAGLGLNSEFARSTSPKFQVVGFIDDAPSKARRFLHGKPVLGTGQDIQRLVETHRIESVIVAMPSVTGAHRLRILRRTVETAVKCHILPDAEELGQGSTHGEPVRELGIEDLLGRRAVEMDAEAIRHRIEGKVVLVTGAAGSIGSELCRQLARFEPLKLIGFDEAETPLFHLDRELIRSFPGLAFYPEIGDITRADHLHQVMTAYRPSIVYHAAAYKHVPMMERQVFAAVENNILGTFQVAQAAVEHGVDDFVLISTDKAVRPASVMGATKRAAELVIRAMQQASGTKFVAVRFGNVLGSSGSVVPIFNQQIAAGGPVTVTHPDMSRYFMTIAEAVQLVLQAFSIGQGGEVFVLDMDLPINIVDLARYLILLSGLKPGRDIAIEFSGMRPGEKLFEELNLEHESLIPTTHSQIRTYTSSCCFAMRTMESLLEEMRHALAERDAASLVRILKEMVPDYNPGAHLLEPNGAMGTEGEELLGAALPSVGD
jgi:FlaA1/EpsC-like NDP-sugar epimerase